MKFIKLFFLLSIICLFGCTKKMYQSEVTYELFNQNSKQPLELINPKNINQTILLSNIKNKNSKQFAKGTYKENDKSKTVSLNASLITMLNNNTKRYTYYVAPFEILDNANNSENFIGLFRYDNNTTLTRHLDSFSIGNNSTVQQITNGYGNSIEVTIADWKNIEAKNSITSTITVEFTDTNFVL